MIFVVKYHIQFANGHNQAKRKPEHVDIEKFTFYECNLSFSRRY